MTDSTGKVRLTYRLRRYLVSYPQGYDSTGDTLDQDPPIDVVYVLDRPVQNTANTDPSRPYTMLGPKPCNFAYYDDAKVVNGVTNGYYSTNHSGWDGKNVDGLHFPNEDTATSCAAPMPVLNHNKTAMSLATSHNLNAASTPNGGTFQTVYIRPGKAWAPHYEEDTSFQACAPLASPFRDPPLHFYKKTASDVRWCAEVYPTKNPSYTSTSHTGGHDWVVGNNGKYPLLAPDVDSILGGGQHGGVNWMLQNDSSFGCTMSYDAGQGKTGVASPSGGCCSTVGIPSSSAHFEPSSSAICGTPSY
jgi:hypothetical protein